MDLIMIKTLGYAKNLLGLTRKYPIIGQNIDLLFHIV